MSVIFSLSTEKRLTSFSFCITVQRHRWHTQTRISVVRHLLFYNTNRTWHFFRLKRRHSCFYHSTETDRHVSNVLFVKYKKQDASYLAICVATKLPGKLHSAPVPAAPLIDVQVFLKWDRYNSYSVGSEYSTLFDYSVDSLRWPTRVTSSPYKHVASP